MYLVVQPIAYGYVICVICMRYSEYRDEHLQSTVHTPASGVRSTPVLQYSVPGTQYSEYSIFIRREFRVSHPMYCHMNINIFLVTAFFDD